MKTLPNMLAIKEGGCYNLDVKLLGKLRDEEEQGNEFKKEPQK